MAHYQGPASESQRVMHLNKKRERELEEIEIKKRKLENDLKVENMESKFSAHYDAVAEDLKSSTVGLLTLEDLKSRQENAVKEREMQLARKDKEELRLLKKEEKEKEKARKKQSQQIKALSFNMLDDEEEEEEEDEGDDKPEKDADEPAKPEPEIEVKPIPGGGGDFLKKKRLGKIEYKSFICSHTTYS